MSDIMETRTDTHSAASPSPVHNAARKQTLLRAQLFQCGLVTAVALASYLFISHFVLQSVQVVGVSMSPTLSNSGRYLLNRFVYLLRDPHPSDIVVIRDPLDQSFSVKRIIARSGDTVCLRDGRIYVNGRALIEPYLPAGMPTFASVKRTAWGIKCGKEAYSLGKDEYFLLGDNRLNSADSRIYGPVPRQNILGAVIH
jgi:signal peptidase I